VDTLSRRNFLNKALLLLSSAVVFPNESEAAIHAGLSVIEQGRSGSYPSYLKLFDTGELSQRAEKLYSFYENCRLCPRDCRVNRLNGQTGKCEATAKLKISSAVPHFGEEAPLVGKGGSGTIFFSHCGLRCVYCQNYTISIEGEGIEVTDERLAESMLKLQKWGCHNINIVTPTHYVPSLVNALRTAIPMGLRIPLVYNTGGYEQLEVLQFLEGIIDIYLPDCKYMDPMKAGMYSSEAYNYPHYVKIALKEMHRQVGDLEVRKGVAVRGLILRHLVLPHRIAGTQELCKFVAENLSKSTYVNIMRQYRPEHRAREYPEIARRISRKEYEEALSWAKHYGLHRLAK